MVDPSPTGTVGVIVNPHAGKDIRRLNSAAGQTSDAVKIGIVQRVLRGAVEQGADRVVLCTDASALGRQAADGVAGPIETLRIETTGSRLDTVSAATALREAGADCVVVLGGDGTCRDVASGWLDAPMIAISTGTNNVFPQPMGGTTAGVAAALVATGAVSLDEVQRSSKYISIMTNDADGGLDHDLALVDAALVRTSFVGARAVTDPDAIAWVVAATADPAGTGLAGIAGRLHPIDHSQPGGVIIQVGPGGREVRVPLSPGVFSTIPVRLVTPVGFGQPVELDGGGVLAFDGERTRPVGAGSTVCVSVEPAGPRVIDVRATVTAAARAGCFDRPTGGGRDSGAKAGAETVRSATTTEDTDGR